MDGREKSDLEILRLYVAERDAPCPGCAYNLRGLTSDRCPECNEPLVLSIGLRDPKQTAFLVGLVGLAAGAGFNVFVVVMWVFASLRRGLHFDWEPWVGYSLVAGVIEGLLVSAWIFKRRAVRSFSRVRRVGLSLATWAVSLANAFIFGSIIR